MATRPAINSASSLRCAFGGWLTSFCKRRDHCTHSSACRVVSCTPLRSRLKNWLPLDTSNDSNHSRKPRSGVLNPATLTFLPERLVRAMASLVKSSHVLILSGHAHRSWGVLAGQPNALEIRSTFIMMIWESGPSMGTPKMAPLAESVIDAVGKKFLGWTSD